MAETCRSSAQAEIKYNCCDEYMTYFVYIIFKAQR